MSAQDDRGVQRARSSSLIVDTEADRAAEGPGPSHDSDRSARRVLVINDTLTDNGALRWALELSRFWLEAEWSVVYFTLKSHVHGRRPPLPPGVSFIYGDEGGARYRKALPKMFGRAVRAAAASNVVLVCSEVPFSLPFGLLAARIARRPFVVYAQSIPEHAQRIRLPQHLRPVWRRCLVQADAIMCVSPGAAESAARLGVSPARITVAPTGIDVRSARQRGRRDPGRMAPGHDRPRLVACGELAAHKGYDILLRALASVRQTGRRPTLTLIGRGPQRAALERLADDLGISDAVMFLGHVEDPLPEIARADAFVHSARVDAAPLVLLEALALGVPTIAADCKAGGPRMVLGGGRLGRLVEPESVPALAAAICAHLDDPADLLGRAREGVDHVGENFAPARTAAIARAVMSNVCGQAVSGGPGARSVVGAW